MWALRVVVVVVASHCGRRAWRVGCRFSSTRKRRRPPKVPALLLRDYVLVVWDRQARN